jgi:hypothetical protein
MTDDFLAKVLGNAARAKVLRAFMFSPAELFTLPTVAKRSGVAAKTAAKEMKALQELGIIKKGKLTITLASGKKVTAKKQKEQTWHFNTDFKHGRALSKFVHEVSPVSHSSIILALKGSGRLAAVILSGSFVGDPTRPADLIIAADGLNEGRLERAIRALEPEFGREIRYAAFSTPEFRYRLTVQDRLIRDTLDFPHLVLLDKTRLL